MITIGVDYHPSDQYIAFGFRNRGEQRTAIEPQRWRG